MAHHRPGPVVDLAFFPGGRHNHRMRLGRPLPAERADAAADARILSREAVIIDEAAPARHGGGGKLRGLESPDGGAPGSVDTSLAGFASGCPHRPGGRTVSPAALR